MNPRLATAALGASLVAVVVALELRQDEALECVTKTSSGYGRLVVLSGDAGLARGTRLVTCEKRSKTALEKLDVLTASRVEGPGCVWDEQYTPDGGVDDPGSPDAGDCFTSLGVDGGVRWPGAWNVIHASVASGPGCVPVTCVVDAPDAVPERRGVPRRLEGIVEDEEVQVKP